MANTKSAKAMILKTERNRIRNRSRLSRIKTFIDKLKKSIEAKDLEVSKINFRNAQSEIMKGKTKGMLKINTASRLISRLNAKVKSLVQASN